MANEVFPPMPQPQIIRRLLFTVGVLLVYRLGCQVTLPGVNADALAGLGGVLKTETVSIFALGVTPFFSVLFAFELIKLIVPPLARWEAHEFRNAQRLSLAIYLLALVAAGFQANGLANAFYGVTRLVDEPGWENIIAVTLVAGTALLCWMGERTTLHGLGNGFWLLLITPMLVATPSIAVFTWSLLRQGAIQPNAIVAAFVFLGVATALIVKTAGVDSASAENRVSGADFVTVWPPLFAASISGFVVSFYEIQAAGIAHLALMAALIAAFNGLQWLGAAPDTRRPVWAIVLVQIFVCAGAELFTQAPTLPFPISGPWFIVIVITAMSFLRAVRAQASSQKPAA